jgi:hypothetical protein
VSDMSTSSSAIHISKEKEWRGVNHPAASLQRRIRAVLLKIFNFYSGAGTKQVTPVRVKGLV